MGGEAGDPEDVRPTDLAGVTGEDWIGLVLMTPDAEPKEGFLGSGEEATEKEVTALRAIGCGVVW